VCDNRVLFGRGARFSATTSVGSRRRISHWATAGCSFTRTARLGALRRAGLWATAFITLVWTTLRRAAAFITLVWTALRRATAFITLVWTALRRATAIITLVWTTLRRATAFVRLPWTRRLPCSLASFHLRAGVGADRQNVRIAAKQNRPCQQGSYNSSDNQ